jgi:phage terminase small subunit
MALTAKQETFVGEYLIDLNATAAAERAGYSAKTAYSIGQRLLKDVEVAQVVQAAMDERAKRTEVTADYVLKGIKDVTERCAKEGEEFNPPSALKGYELLGKHLKLFTDKVEHSGGVALVRVTETDERI